MLDMFFMREVGFLAENEERLVHCINEIRITDNVTLQEMSNKMGISMTTLRNFLKCRKESNDLTRLKMAKYSGME